jgi:drug/metabolite transporter (DMT)-like permease
VVTVTFYRIPGAAVFGAPGNVATVNARAWSLFSAVSIIWGIPYLLIKVSLNGGMTPVTLAWGRMVIGGAVLLAIAARKGALRQLRGHWRPLIVYALVELAIPFPLIATGERHIPSSLAAIVIATTPLLVALIAFGVDRTQTIGGRRLAGLLIGLAGVALMVGVDASTNLTTLLSVGAVFIAAIGYSLGPLILNRHLMHIDPIASMGTCLLTAAVMLTPLSVIDWPKHMPTAGSLSALLALALVCSAAAFVLMAQLIAAIGPGRAVVITYINPIVALVLGVIFLSETPGLGAIAGLVLILAGSRLATTSRGEPPDTRENRLSITDAVA